jgi:hypothetical protein
VNDTVLCENTNKTTLCVYDTDSGWIAGRCSPAHFQPAFDAWICIGSVMLGLVGLHLFASTVFARGGVPMCQHVDAEAQNSEAPEIFSNAGNIAITRDGCIGVFMGWVWIFGTLVLIVTFVLFVSTGVERGVFKTDSGAFGACATMYGQVDAAYYSMSRLPRLTVQSEEGFRIRWHLNKSTSEHPVSSYSHSTVDDEAPCAFGEAGNHGSCGTCDPIPVVLAMIAYIFIVNIVYFLYGKLYRDIIFGQNSGSRRYHELVSMEAPAVTTTTTH